MKSFENEIIIAFQELAKEIGSEIRRNPEEKYCIEIPGKEVTLRVYWEVDRNQGVFVTLFKEADIGKRSREYHLGSLIEFKNGSLETVREAAKPGAPAASIVAKEVRKYAMGYLLGTEKDFPEFVEYVKREREQRRSERPSWTESLKNLKYVRVRPEWIPEEED
jgi:hypothetical protein